MSRLLRRLLPPVLSAALATAVAVPVTWHLTNRNAVPAAAEATPAPTRPTDREELRARLLAQLGHAGGAVVLEMSRDGDVATGLPPGRYRIDLICGLMQVPGGGAQAFTIHLRTPDQYWTIELPCPSTALTPDAELDFTGAPAGAAVAGLEYGDSRPVGLVLLLRFIPVTGEDGGGGD